MAVLLIAFGQRLGTDKFRHNWGRVQWVVALGLLPLLLLLFGRAPVIAPLVNLVAVPLFSLVLLPIVLVASLLGLLPGLGLELPLVLTAEVLERGFGVLEAVSGWDWMAAVVSRRPIWVWVSAFAGVLLLLAPRGLPGAWLGSLFLLPLALIRPPAPSEGTAEFTLFDVGQGLVAVVRTRRHVLVYDTGPRFSSGFNTGTAVILPYLYHQGVWHIDTLLVAGHHGSATSTGSAFLATVAPHFVLYAAGAGYANRFGLPNPAVRKWVAAQGTAQLDTASAGAISFRLGPAGIAGPWSFRREHRRLWSHRVESISSRKGARD